jgi:DNA-binding IclR family transcriptional regulator
MDADELLDEGTDETHHPENIIAPVFGPDASVALAITLTGLKPATGAEIHEMAVGVVEAGQRLTRSIGGHVPRVKEDDRTAS